CPPRLRDFTWHYLSRLANRERRVLDGHTKPVTAVVFSPDGGTLASASQDGTIRLWNANDWSPRGTLPGHRGPVNALAFLPEPNALVSAGDDLTVRRWNIEAGTSEVLARDAAAVKLLAASEDGKLLAWATSGLLLWGDGAVPRITLWDVPSGTIKRQLI